MAALMESADLTAGNALSILLAEPRVGEMPQALLRLLSQYVFPRVPAWKQQVTRRRRRGGGGGGQGQAPWAAHVPRRRPADLP